MRVIIDRFEGEFAVVELPDSKKMVTVPIELFPDAAEGDIVDITINRQETKNREKAINERFDKLKKK